jgi:hypothetical protein
MSQIKIKIKMTPSLQEHFKFQDEMEKLFPGFKKAFRKAIKQESIRTKGMNMIEFFKTFDYEQREQL